MARLSRCDDLRQAANSLEAGHSGGEVCTGENRQFYERDLKQRYGKDDRVAGRGKGVPTDGSREEDFH
ncbi:hypothetical protein Tco_1445396 [Tanacetum coccineum]